MYCSIDKVDLDARVDGKQIAVQTDDRQRDEIERALELSAVFAMSRVINARAQLAAGGAVHYVVSDAPPQLLRDALVATGATIERADQELALEPLGPGSDVAASVLADRCFAAIARNAAARVGSRDLAVALRMLEDQTYAAAPARDDEAAYWTRVVELAALAGELVRTKYAGSWVVTERAVVPFGFQLDTAGGGAAVLLPTNRAQRVVEDGSGESLFKLMLAADETVHRPTDVSSGRLMPSLRARRDVELHEVVWRPLLADEPGDDVPIVVCGLDGENTYGMIRREALDRSIDDAFTAAFENLTEEPVEYEIVDGDDTEVAVVTGSFYAAEKLLDREFMRELHERLDAKLLAVAVPSRGCMLASPARAEQASYVLRFGVLARSRFTKAGGRAISPAVLIVQDGEVIGVAPRSAEAQATRADTQPGVPAPRGSSEQIDVGDSGGVAGWLRRLLGRK